MRHISPVLLVMVLMPGAARAQPAQAPPSRADIAVAAGWFAADRSLPGYRARWSGR
jgi:hypothetical protein